MATASILSRVTAPVVKIDRIGISRDDLTINDVVELESVNVGTAYQWNIAFKPEDQLGTPSTAVFTSTGTEQAIIQNPGTFTVDLDGPYLLRLAYTTPQITLNTVLTAGVTFTINGILLTAVAGARTPGSDDFSVASGTAAGIVADIVAAINDPLNSFVAANLAGTDSSPSVVISPTLATVPTGETIGIFYSGTASDVTIGDLVTEQYVRLRALTAFGDLKLVAAGERYDTLRVPVDAEPDGWADNQNYNLNQLLSLISSNTLSTGVVTVDPINGDFQTIQAAMDYANAQTPTLAQQWVVLVRPGIYVEDLTFYPWVHLFGWPGGEKTPLVKVQNDTVASHSIALPGVGTSLVLCDIYFEQPVVSPNPAFLQVGVGDVQVFRCTLEAQGNTGEVWSTSGPTTFTRCTINGNGVNPTDYALRVSSGSFTILDHTTVLGQSCLILEEGAGIYVRDSRFSASGTYALNSLGYNASLNYTLVTGLIAGNPAGTGTAGDLIFTIKWCEIGNLAIDGQNVVGSARADLGATSHGTLTNINGALLSATVPADTILYDPTVSGLSATNVQDAIDEVYAYAQLVRTLDDAYDGGIVGTGSGRTIIADQGAVQIVDAAAPSDPIPPGNTDGNLEVVGSVKLGALTKPEITVDPNPFDNGPTILLGKEIWANDAPFGSTALILGDASGNPTFHNYNLRVGTKEADGGNQVGSVFVRAGDSLTTIDAGAVYLQGGTATDAGGGVGGDIIVVPGETAAGGARAMVLANPLTATSATLTAAGAFSGAAVAGTLTLGTETGAITVTFVGGEVLAAVHALFDATGIVTAAGDPIVLTTVMKGGTAEAFFLNETPAGVDAALGTFSGQAMVSGTWPDTVELGASAPGTFIVGVNAANPMLYDTATGKLTVPGLIDPTGVIFDEAGQPATGAAKGAVFVSDGSVGVQNDLYYTDQAGALVNLSAAAAGVTNHAALTNLSWLLSAHIGANGSLATFDGATGAATLLTGVAQGDLAYFDGTDWTRLAPGAAGQLLQTQGIGADPIWAAGVGTDELVKVTANDTTPGYLLDKLITATTGVAWTEINNGADEDLRLDVSTASTAGQGLIEIATQAEVDGGADTTRAVTPAALASATTVIKPGDAPTGDLGGTYPNPMVTDFTIAGESQGSVLYFNGVNWSQLSPGVVGQVLQTQGVGANPLWAAGGAGSSDHATLSNILWTASAHTGTASRIAAFDGGGAASYVQVGVDVQAWDTDLDALAALATTGLLVRTGAGTATTRSIVQPAAGITVTNANGVAGDPTLALADDLAALEALAGTGIAVRTAANTWAERTLTGTLNRITVTNGDGVAGNPTLDVGSNVLVSGDAAGGDLSGTFPNPTVTDLTLTSEAQGTLVYFSGTNWVVLPVGINGQLLQTQGAGANPQWVTSSATDELVKVTANDTTPGYLFDKLTTATTGIAWTEINDGADEDLRLDIDSATAGGQGLIELATQLEVDTGTDTTRAIVPSTLAGSVLAGDVTANNAKVTNATHTGDVIGATVLTIDANKVLNTMLVDMASARFKGRVTAGVGDPEDLTGTQATTLLDTFTSALQGVVPASGGVATDFLSADGTWAVPAGSGGVTNTVVGSLGITNVGTNTNADLAPTYGAVASTITEGNDARLSDARVPTGAAGGDLGGTYPNPTVDDGADGTAIHDNIAGEILAVTLKAVPVSADVLLIEDSADANNKKRITVGTLPTGGGGEANTASNVGTAGVGLFKQKTGIDLEFKKVNAGSTKVTITDDVGNDEVDVDVVDASLTQAGAIELATQLEVDTGTDTTRAIVPSTLAGSTLASNVTANNAKITNATHTGDVTGATALTITADAVTNAMLANVATATIKGRVTAATGDPEDLTGTQATTLLDTFTSALQGVVPASGGVATDFLSADGTWSVPPGGGGQTNTVVGTLGITNVGTNVDADLAPTYGTTASTITEGNDARLSDARTPTAHAASHQDGGSDEIATATPAAAAIPKADVSGTLDAWISAASATTAGIMETATAVEVDTGTDATRAVSPLSLAGSTLAGDVTANNAKITNATHTGDVTGATALTITADAVTNAMLANVATATFKGRVTAATGDPEDLTGTQATTLLDTFTTALQGVVPASGGVATDFLSADGTWSVPAGGGGAIDTGNTLWVDSVFGSDPGTSDRQDLPWATIGAAIAAAVSGDTIMVRPGTYAEEGLAPPGGVSLRSQGGWQTTFIGFTAGRTADLITLDDEVSIQGFTLYVSASASFAAVAYSGGGGSNTAAMYEIRFLGDGLTGVGIGISKTGIGKIIGAEIRYDNGGIGIGMQSSGGAIALEGIHYPEGAGTFATAAKVTGTGRLQLADFNVGNPSIVDTFEVGGGTLLVYGVNVFSAQNIVHMTADGTFIGLYGGKMEGTVDFLLDPAVTWTSATTMQVTAAHQANYSFPPTGVNVEFELAFFQEKTPTHQASFSVLAQGVSFGFPELGAITHIGRGKAYVGGMAVWTTDNTALPASDGATLTDVSATAASLSGSTFTFQGLPAASVGTSIIFTTLRVDAAGVALPFWGVQLKQAVAAGGGTYVFEVRTAANTWVEVDFQAVAVELDSRYSADVFLRPNSDENLRMGVYGGDPDPLLPDGTAWPPTTIGVIGTGRFARIRVTVAPTAFPTWERLAITPSHSMFNGDGERVAHGLAMWRKTIAAGGNVFGESGGVGNASKPVGSGGGTTGWNHSMPNSRIDNPGNAIYFQQGIPEGICTAYPLQVAMVYTMRAGGGTVTTAPVGILSLIPVQVSGTLVADPSGGLVPVARAYTATETLIAKPAQTDTENLDGGATLPANLEDKALRTEFGPFSIQGYYEGDLFFVRFEMDAEGTPAQDVEVFSMIISGVAFSEGGPL